MNVITAIMVIILFGMFCGLLIKIRLINKGKKVPKSIPSQLLEIFALIPRGFLRELKTVFNSVSDTKVRLKALINVVLVVLLLLSSIVGSIVLLIYAPFGGGLCEFYAFLLIVLGLSIGACVAHMSIHKAF